MPVYTKPYPCGGECIYCPKDKGIPNSYIENEDTLFAKAHFYSPSIQFARFKKRFGGDKVYRNVPFEIIILGGSFSSLSKSYRVKFVSELYEAMSNIKDDSSGHDFLNRESFEWLPSIVTVESRPDQINTAECEFLRKIGISKVEIGVQHTLDLVLDANCRGHDQASIIQATRVLKNEGFKVGYHVMAGLPYAAIEDDIEMLRTTLWLPEYSPDYLKVYPCVLLNNKSLQPHLSNLAESGKWKAINERKFTCLMKILRKNIPSYVRISRIQRQFEDTHIKQGIRQGFRRRTKIKFLDIRSREVGFVSPDIPIEELKLTEMRINKKSNDIIVELLSQNNILLGIIRLAKRTDGNLVIRELRVYGKATPIGSRGLIQGNGLGVKLLSIGESIGEEIGAKKIFVNASPGARAYFEKHGYRKNGSFLLEKSIHSNEDLLISAA